MKKASLLFADGNVSVQIVLAGETIPEVHMTKESALAAVETLFRGEQISVATAQTLSGKILYAEGLPIDEHEQEEDFDLGSIFMGSRSGSILESLLGGGSGPGIMMISVGPGGIEVHNISMRRSKPAFSLADAILGGGFPPFGGRSRGFSGFPSLEDIFEGLSKHSCWYFFVLRRGRRNLNMSI